MRIRPIVTGLVVITAGGVIVAYKRGSVTPLTTTVNAEAGHHGSPGAVTVTPQARINLGLEVEKIALSDYWQTVTVPGIVTELPGRSERRLTTNVNGIILRVMAFPGQTVKAGDPLVELQPTGELLSNAQSALLRAVQEIDILKAEIARLKPLSGEGVPKNKIIEKQAELDRQEALRRLLTQDLLVRGLREEQIQTIVETKTLIRSFLVRVPEIKANPESTENNEVRTFSIERIGVFPGKLVQPGEEIADLAYHTNLYIQGQAFERESRLVAKAIQEQWPIEAVFDMDDTDGLQRKNLRILYVDNSVDPETRTLRFYIPLANEVLRDALGDDGVNYRTWLFKPGQKVQLLVPTAKREQRIVLPADPG